MRSIKNITYTRIDDEEFKFDIHIPNTDTFDLFIYFHGGGLVAGDKESADTFAPYLTDHGIAVASFDYRMMPKHKYPAFLEDAASAVKYMFDHAGDYGNCKRIFVGGSSAGAYLSMMLCFDRRWLSSVGVNADSVAGYLHDAGQPTAHFNVLAESGIDSRRVIVDNSAPLYHIGLEKEYPPMHFIVSDNDMACRYEQTMLTLSTLKHFGYDQEKISYDVMHGTHCAYINAKDASGESVFGKITEKFINGVK